MSEFLAMPPTTRVPAGTEDAGTATVAPIEVLLVGLEQRLEAQPDDVDGWILLSKSYYHLNRFEAAKEAFEKARALGYAGDWQPLPRIDAFSQSGQPGNGFDPAIDFRGAEAADVSNHASASPASATDSGGLRLKISLDPALAGEVSPGAAVFVFVRAAQNPGPPLAVVRRQVNELPFEVVLNDGNAMIAGKTISSAASVIAGARISASGDPRRQRGDYEQLSEPVPANFPGPVELVISKRI